MPKRSWSGPAGSILAILAVGLVCVSAAAANEGTIKAIRNAESSFNEYTDAPSPATKEWLRTHFWRILAFSPYFDSRTSWYPNAWAYRDAYAVYNGNPLVQQHPEWILKDNTGKKLYIPWGCSGAPALSTLATSRTPAFARTGSKKPGPCWRMDTRGSISTM